MRTQHIEDELNAQATDDDVTRAALRPLIERADERYRTAEDRALDVLRRAIDLGVFQPGERLQQDRLASFIGVSRMPIRSALRQLESEGFVTLEPHRGAAVRSVTQSEIRDLYEIRILVESFALKRVALRADSTDLRRLGDLAEKIDSAASRDERASRMDEFYRKLYETGNTRRVVSLVMQLRSEVNRYAPTKSHGGETHRELLDALSMDDPDLAAAWLAAHFRRRANASVRRQVESSAAEGSDESA